MFKRLQYQFLVLLVWAFIRADRKQTISKQLGQVLLLHRLLTPQGLADQMLLQNIGAQNSIKLGFSECYLTLNNNIDGKFTWLYSVNGKPCRRDLWFLRFKEHNLGLLLHLYICIDEMLNCYYFIFLRIEIMIWDCDTALIILEVLFAFYDCFGMWCHWCTESVKRLRSSDPSCFSVHPGQ